MRGGMTVLELFKNAAKIKQLYDEQKYLAAVALLAKTLAALLGEFGEGEGGQPVLKGSKKPKAADVKNLEKAESVLTELQSANPPVGADTAGSGIGLTIFLQLLPIVLDIIRRRREQNG